MADFKVPFVFLDKDMRGRDVVTLKTWRKLDEPIKTEIMNRYPFDENIQAYVISFFDEPMAADRGPSAPNPKADGVS